MATDSELLMIAEKLGEISGSVKEVSKIQRITNQRLTHLERTLGRHDERFAKLPDFIARFEAMEKRIDALESAAGKAAIKAWKAVLGFAVAVMTGIALAALIYWLGYK